ncbi:MAG: hypothetical protein ACK2UU_00325 [Anaerolineae bacterium]|jgi:hypothetical protein
MPDLKGLPMIAEAEHGRLVGQLLAQLKYLPEENRWQTELIQEMRNEIVVLKGRKRKSK